MFLAMENLLRPGKYFRFRLNAADPISVFGRQLGDQADMGTVSTQVATGKPLRSKQPYLMKYGLSADAVKQTITALFFIVLYNPLVFLLFLARDVKRFLLDKPLILTKLFGSRVLATAISQLTRLPLRHVENSLSCRNSVQSY
jgi:hypothetical protein